MTVVHPKLEWRNLAETQKEAGGDRQVEVGRGCQEDTGEAGCSGDTKVEDLVQIWFWCSPSWFSTSDCLSFTQKNFNVETEKCLKIHQSSPVTSAL